jgi:hypothetical protein
MKSLKKIQHCKTFFLTAASDSMWMLIVQTYKISQFLRIILIDRSNNFYCFIHEIFNLSYEPTFFAIISNKIIRQEYNFSIARRTNVQNSVEIQKCKFIRQINLLM